MSQSGRHVIPNPQGGWSVRKSGATRATRVFDTQQAAESFARNLTKKEHGELYIHRKDGTIPTRMSLPNMLQSKSPDLAGDQFSRLSSNEDNVMRKRLPTGNMVFALLFAAILSAGVIPAAAEPLAGANSCPDVNTPPSTINLAAQTQANRIRDAIRCLINAERTSRNLPALSVSQKLTNAADGHAQEAARLRWWIPDADSHVHPTTLSTPQGRIIAAGYCGGQPTQTGEITYTGTGNDATEIHCPLVACSTPAAAVNWWMNISTSGHRGLILSPNFRELGVGVSGIGANKLDSLQDHMGTYVVDFGDCPALETPPPPPPIWRADDIHGRSCLQ